VVARALIARSACSMRVPSTTRAELVVGRRFLGARAAAPGDRLIGNWVDTDLHGWTASSRARLH
jgi:hypothetical protein